MYEYDANNTLNRNTRRCCGSLATNTPRKIDDRSHTNHSTDRLRHTSRHLPVNYIPTVALAETIESGYDNGSNRERYHTA